MKLDKQTLILRCNMYGIAISEEEINGWVNLWETTAERFKTVLVGVNDGKYVLKHLTKKDVDEHSVHLFMMWSSSIKEPSFMVASEHDAKKYEDDLAENENWFIGENTGYYDVRNFTHFNLTGVKEETVNAENFEHFLLVYNLTRNSFFVCDPSSEIKNLTLRTKKSIEKFIKTNLRELNYNSLYDSKYELYYLGWFTKCIIDKQLEEVFPNLHHMLVNGDNHIVEKNLSDDSNKITQTIMDVYEDESGGRYFVMAGNTSVGGHRKEDIDYSIHYLPSDDENWQYVDIGRRFYFDTSGTKQTCDRIKHRYYSSIVPIWQLHYSDPFNRCKIIFLEDEPILPKIREPIEYYIKRANEDQISYLNNRDTDRLIKLYNRSQQELVKEQQEKKLFKTKWDKRLDKLNGDHKLRVELNEVTYSYKQVVYEKQVIQCDVINPVDILKQLSRVYQVEQINFDRYLDTFLDIMGARIKYPKTTDQNITGQMGDIPFKVTFDDRVDSNGRRSLITLVNNIRINKDEVVQVIRQALCFNNLQSYNKFLEGVSKCSLRIHGYLHYGLQCRVKDDFLGLNMHMKFKINREKNRHFLSFDNREFPIHNINRLLQIEEQINMNEVLKILEDPTIITIDIVSLAPIIKKAKLEYENAIKKADALLERVSNMIGVKIEDRALNGNQLKGYVIEGKLRKYFLEYSQEAAVYDLNTERKLCIVEKSGHGPDPTDQVGVDKIVNRMLALKNDHKIVDQVHTLAY